MSDRDPSNIVDRALQKRADIKKQRQIKKERDAAQITKKAQREAEVVKGAKTSYKEFTIQLKELLEETKTKLGYESDELIKIELGDISGKVYFGQAVLGTRYHQSYSNSPDVRAFMIFGYKSGMFGRDVDIVTQQEWVADADDHGVFWKRYEEVKTPEELAHSCFLILVEMETKHD